MSKDIKFRVHLNVDGKDQIVTATTSVKDLQRSMKSAKDSATRFHDAMVKFAGISTIVKDTSAAVEGLAGKLNEYQNKNLSVQQQTQLTGEAMSALRSEVQAVADTYGKDFSEVLTGVSRLMKGFGISSEEAMRLVRDGMMSGADATGQMFDILSEYPAYFKEAGMNAEQFMAVITNGANMGVFNDKAADTIKEGNLRLREMTSATREALNGIGLDSEKIQGLLRSGLVTTFEVMQQVGAKLKELPQTSAEVGTAIADIFGGPGEDARLAYIESLANIELGMQKLTEGASDSNKALDAQVDCLATVNNVLSGVIDQFNLVPALQPFLNITSQIGMTAVGIGSLIGGLKTLNVVQMLSKGKAMATSIAYTLMGGSARGAAAGVSTLALSIRALMVATGIGAAVMVLAQAVDYLARGVTSAEQKSEALSSTLEENKQHEEQLAKSYASVRVEMAQNIGKLKEFKGSKEEEAKLVDQMNNKYGESMGYYSSVKDWYTALAGNSEAYCRQMIREIQIRDLANKAAEQKAKADQISKGLKNGSYSTKNKTRTVTDGYGNSVGGAIAYTHKEEIKGTSEAAKKQKELTAATKEYNEALEEMNKLVKANEDTTYRKYNGWQSARPGTSGGKGSAKSSSSVSTKATSTAVAGSIDWFEEKISALSKQISATSDVGEAQNLIGRKAMLEAGLKSLKVKIGLEVDESAGDGDVLSRLEEINSICETLGIEPISLEFDTKDVDKAKEKFNTAAGAVAQMGNSLSGLGGALEMPELDIAGTIAQAVANVAMGYSNATAQAASMGPWAWIAFAATGLAQMVAIISAIKNATGFATGGVVGGNSRSGDRLIARVNSGEMILNSAQQRRLFDIVNGVNIGAASTPNVSEASVGSLAGAAEQTFKVEFAEPRWRGTGMVLGIQNVRRVMGKSGRKG